MADQTPEAIATWAEQQTAPKPARKIGRPSILTDELTQQIAEMAREGHYIETVCQSLGIHKATLYRWLEQGEADIEQHLTTPHSTFCDVLKQAEAESEVDIGRKWLKADGKEWLKYATFSSRRFRKHWHDKEPEQRNTYVQHNYALMPGQANYTVPALPSAIAADVLSPAHPQPVVVEALLDRVEE